MNLKDKISNALYGKSVTDAQTSRSCLHCGVNVDELGFSDALSKREYLISGMCQNCQDAVFNMEED